MPATTDVTTKNPEHMTDRERLIALRLLKRRLLKVKKLWNGKVSECRTALEHLQDDAIPERDSDCRIRLERLKTKADELDTMKKDRKSALDAIDRTMDEILYAAPATAEQLELGATRTPITKESIRELRTAVAEAQVDDREVAEKGETPKYPAEKAADMADLLAHLETMMEESGLDSVGFAAPIPADQTDPDAPGPEMPEAPKAKKAKPEGKADTRDDGDKAPRNTGGGRSSKGRDNLSVVPT